MSVHSISAKGEPARDWKEWIGPLDASEAGDFAKRWLHSLSVTLPGCREAVLMGPGTGSFVVIAQRTAHGPTTTDLCRHAQRAAGAADPIIAWARRPEAGGALDLLIGLGVDVDGTRAFVVAVAMDVPGGVQSVDPDAIAKHIYVACGWLAARMARERAEATTARLARAGAAMDIVAVAGANRGLGQVAGAVVNELAVRLACDRVAMGLFKRGAVKLRALSHAASFQERSRIAEALENAMEECVVQSAPIAFPAAAQGGGPIHLAHRELSRLALSSGACASVPLPGPQGPIGALTFERAGETPFESETLRLMEAIGALLGPVLCLHLANDRWVAGRAVDLLREAIAGLFGKERPSLKLFAILTAVTIGALCLANGDFHVTARAVVEGQTQRAAVAPFDGFIASSTVRPGDHIHAGDVLAALDDSDLVLERTRAWAEVEKLRQKYNESMAKHDRPDAAILSAQIDEAQAQLALAEDKIQRSRIVSPIEGLLVSGDLSQLLGSPVERGKTLFEVAPLDHYRIVLQTDEEDLSDVALGQSGRLSLVGMPNEKLAFAINRITPIAETKDGRNQFRIEAILTDPAGPGLRPGMEGVGKIDAGRHRLIWVWAHGLINWLRLTAWKWMP